MVNRKTFHFGLIITLMNLFLLPTKLDVLPENGPCKDYHWLLPAVMNKNSDDENASLIQQRNLELLNFVKQFIIKRDWKNFVFITDFHQSQMETFIKEIYKLYSYTVIVKCDEFSSSFEYITHFFVFCKEESQRSVLQKASSINLLQGKTSWMIISHTEKSVTNVPIGCFCNVFLSSIVNIEGESLLPLVIKISKVVTLANGNVMNKLITSWNSDDKILQLPRSLYRPLTLTGEHIVITAMQNSPFVYLNSQENVWHGWMTTIMEIIAEKLNFTYDMIPPRENKFGSNKSGNWGGMIGMLHRNEADIAIGSISMTGERLQVVDFIATSVVEVSMEIVLSTSRVHEFVYDVYTKPLSIPVWIIILVFVFIIGVTLITTNYFSPQPINTTHPNMSASECLEFCFHATIHIQSPICSPPSSSVRVVYLTTLILSLVVYASFCSNFTSFVTIATDDKLPFKTMEELVMLPNYHILTLDGGSYLDLIKNSKSGIYSQVWKKIKENYNFSVVNSLEEAIEKIFISNSAYLESNHVIRHAIKTNCSFTIAPSKYNTEGSYFAINKNFKHTKAIEIILQKALESGIIQKLSAMNKATTCQDSRKKGTGDSSLLTVITPFIILAGGWVTAISIFVLECAVQHILTKQGTKASIRALTNR